MTVDYRVELLHIFNYLRYERRVEFVKVYKFNIKFLADGMVSIETTGFDLVCEPETALIFAQKQGAQLGAIVKDGVEKIGRDREIPYVDMVGIWAEIDEDARIAEEKRKLEEWLKTATKEQIFEYKRGLALAEAAKIMGKKERKAKENKVLASHARKIAKMNSKVSRYIIESEGINYIAVWAESGEHIEFRKQIAGDNPFECEQFPVCIISVKAV